jgi:hypothetical protein
MGTGIRDVLARFVAKDEITGLKKKSWKKSVGSLFVPILPAPYRPAGPVYPLPSMWAVTVRRPNSPRFTSRGLPRITYPIGIDDLHPRTQFLKVKRCPYSECSGANNNNIRRVFYLNS